MKQDQAGNQTTGRVPRRLLLAVIALGVATRASAQELPKVFAEAWAAGGISLPGSVGSVEINDLAVTDHAVYVVGRASGWVDFNHDGSGGLDEQVPGGPPTLFLAKYGDMGRRFEWRAYLLSDGAQHGDGLSVAVDPTNDDVYVGGWFRGNSTLVGPHGNRWVGRAEPFGGLLAKFNRDGWVLWVKPMTGNASFDNVRVHDVAVDAQHNVFVAGVFDVEVGLSRAHFYGSSDGFLASYTSEGVQRWARQIAGPGHNGAAALAIAGDHVLLAGDTVPGVDFDADGVADLTLFDTWQAYVAGYDKSSGRFESATAVGGKSTLDIATHGHDAWVLTDGAAPRLVYLFLPGGGFVPTGGAGSFPGRSLPRITAGRLATDRWGRLFLTGSFDGSIDLDADGRTDMTTPLGIRGMFVACYPAGGASSLEWTTMATGTYQNQPTALGVRRNGSLFVGGVFSSPEIVFDEHASGGRLLNPYPVPGAAFLARYDPFVLWRRDTRPAPGVPPIVRP
jgi:hypothetical protein